MRPDGQDLENGMLRGPHVLLAVKVRKRYREDDFTLFAGREVDTGDFHGVASDVRGEPGRDGLGRAIRHGRQHIYDALLNVGGGLKALDRGPVGEEQLHRVGDAGIVVETFVVLARVRHRRALRVLRPGVPEADDDFVLRARLEERTDVRLARDEVVGEESGPLPVHEYRRAEGRHADAERRARRNRVRCLPRGAAPESLLLPARCGRLHERPVPGHGDGARKRGGNRIALRILCDFRLPYPVKRHDLRPRRRRADGSRDKHSHGKYMRAMSHCCNHHPKTLSCFVRRAGVVQFMQMRWIRTAVPVAPFWRLAGTTRRRTVCVPSARSSASMCTYG